MVLLFTLFLLGMKECGIRVAPLITLSPLRYLRINTHLENPSKWWVGTLFLVDEEGEILRHQLFEGDMALHEPKNRVEEFKQLSLPEGIYEVQFVVATREGERCIAKQPIEVHGEQH